MSFISELSRRNVFRVAIAYAALAWLMAQVAALLLETFAAPAWVLKSLIALFLVGFPFAVFFAWAYELTPEGIRREREVERGESITTHTARRLDRVIIVLLVLALGAFAWDRFAPRAPDVAEVPAGEAAVAADAPSPAAPAEAAGPPRESIAVLPFANMSDDPGNEFFSEGISEEILNLLARLPGLHVTSRSSAFQFKGDDIHIPTVAQQLGVAHILEGSVRKAGNRVRITAQLIDAGADRHLWSETWDRELTDIFAIQDEIAGAVVGVLETTLLASRPALALDQSARTDARAYELYLHGRHLTWTREPEPLGEAVRLFEQAIEIDPNYAPAYAGLATAYFFLAGVGFSEPREAYALMDAAIVKALELDPGNSEAFAALGLLRSGQGRFEEARNALGRAIELNPNDAHSYYWLGFQYSYSDPVRALELSQKAYAINPLVRVVVAGVAWSLMPLGRYEEAMAQIRRYQAQFGADPWALRTAGGIRVYQGRADLALKSFYQAYRTRPEVGYGFGVAPLLLLDLGEPELAAAWSAEILQVSPAMPPATFNSLFVAAVMGDLPPAIERAKGAAARSDTPWFDDAVALGYMMNGEFEQARTVLEEARPNLAEDPPAWDHETWPTTSNFAAALYRIGATDRAEPLAAELAAFFERQLAAGVVHGVRATLREELAMIYTLQGRPDEAIGQLRAVASQGVPMCMFCFEVLPHYAGLRGRPDFEALVDEQRARMAAKRQVLADEGMLLTPAEVLALEDFEFDPLAQ